MTQNEFERLKGLFTSSDYEFLELGKTILATHPDEEIREFIKKLNASQKKFLFKTKKNIGIYRIEMTPVV